MEIRAEHYFQAAQERIVQARGILALPGSFSLTMYALGLAVECMLRAYRWRIDPTFDGRHVLLVLFRACGMKEDYERALVRRRIPEVEVTQRLRELWTDVQYADYVWSNDLRYADEARAKARLKRLGQSVGIKGDFLKANASRLLTIAERIVRIGVDSWGSKKK